MDTAPTKGNTDLSSLMAQTQQQSSALQALEATIRNLAAASSGGSGGGGGQLRNNSNKNSDNPFTTTTTGGEITIY